jgi:hypothetical protein
MPSQALQIIFENAKSNESSEKRAVRKKKKFFPIAKHFFFFFIFLHFDPSYFYQCITFSCFVQIE